MHYVSRKRTSVRTLVVTVAAMVLTPLVGFWGTFDLARGIYASIYLAVCVAWFILAYTKFVCVNCSAYGKLCPRGLGELAALFFRPDTGNEYWGNRLAKLFWPYWFLGVPAFGLALLLASRLGWRTFGYAAAFGTAAAYSWIVERRLAGPACRENRLTYRVTGVSSEPE